MSILFDTVIEVDFKLGVDSAPVLPPTGPFFGYIDHGQIQHFKEAVVGREYRFTFSYLTELTVESFDGIGGVNQLSDLFRVLEVSR